MLGHNESSTSSRDHPVLDPRHVVVNIVSDGTWKDVKDVIIAASDLLKQADDERGADQRGTGDASKTSQTVYTTGSRPTQGKGKDKVSDNDKWTIHPRVVFHNVSPTVAIHLLAASDIIIGSKSGFTQLGKKRCFCGGRGGGYSFNFLKK